MTSALNQPPGDLAHAAAVAAHELSHDLDAARQVAEQLDAAVAGGDAARARAVLAALRASLDRLGEDIERMVTDDGRALTRLERSPTNLANLVRRVVDAHPTGRHPVEVSAAEVVIRLDRIKVERMLDNLLANALEHTPDTCPVRVAARAEPGAAVLVVEDDGPGLPSHVRELLLRCTRGPTDPPADVGMGLWIVVQLARLHGGNVTVTPTRPGAGARFTVRLPARDQ